MLDVPVIWSWIAWQQLPNTALPEPTFEILPQTLILLGRHSHIAHHTLSKLRQTAQLMWLCYLSHCWCCLSFIFTPCPTLTRSLEILPHCMQVQLHQNLIPIMMTLDIHSAKGWDEDRHGWHPTTNLVDSWAYGWWYRQQYWEAGGFNVGRHTCPVLASPASLA